MHVANATIIIIMKRNLLFGCFAAILHKEAYLLLKLGLIGFGEAGYYLTTGMKEVQLYTYDVLSKENSARGAKIRENAKNNGASFVDSLEDLAEVSNIIFCLTSANSAVPIAKSVAPLLRDDRVYCDLNSTSPATKESIGKIFEAYPAHFVEAAIMASVPANKTKVPIYVCGSLGAETAIQLNNIGMNVTFKGERLGVASATKMLKSVLFKGFIALLTETIFASDQYGITEEILQAFKHIITEEMTYEECCDYFMGTMVTHSKRLSYEMEEVLATLESMGENSIMTKATLEKMHWITDQGYNQEFALRPDGYVPILEYKRKQKIKS